MPPPSLSERHQKLFLLPFPAACIITFIGKHPQMGTFITLQERTLLLTPTCTAGCLTADAQLQMLLQQGQPQACNPEKQDIHSSAVVSVILKQKRSWWFCHSLWDPDLVPTHCCVLSPPSPLPSPSRDLQLLLVSVSPARCMSKPHTGETEFEDPAFEGLRRMDSPISSKATLPCYLCSVLNSPRTILDAQRNTIRWKGGCGETFSPQLPSSFPNFFLFCKDLAVHWVLLMSQRAQR